MLHSTAAQGASRGRTEESGAARTDCGARDCGDRSDTFMAAVETEILEESSAPLASDYAVPDENGLFSEEAGEHISACIEGCDVNIQIIAQQDGWRSEP